MNIDERVGLNIRKYRLAHRLTLEELDYLSCGMVWDMLTEQSNDNREYPIVAGQKEFNEFLG